LIFLRQQTPPGTSGLLLAFWALSLVWATDVGAYFAGRAIGGPKLAPRVSPSKTWAGLAGGVLAALVLGFLLHRFAGLPIQLAAASGLLAVAAQLGDLLESHMKRRAGVKDSGTLLPGHGGVMDRLDGVVAAAPLAALAYLLLVLP
ncbi:MAG TPA: phosphatidate cytidylyltransferase, partial [Sphingobium sp.]|nr:phosphatidate cytidylyltransferase [Sphingobium sp.]